MNYYRQFILHFSTLVAPISAWTKRYNNPRIWTSEAKDAFSHLKSAFTSAMVLHHPDPVDKPFYLDVDASCIGVGAVLSQRNSTGKTVTCGFFSPRPSCLQLSWTCKSGSFCWMEPSIQLPSSLATKISCICSRLSARSPAKPKYIVDPDCLITAATLSPIG